MPHDYDIAVLGATPAGYAAATYLTKKKLDVVVLDVPLRATESPLLDWAPKDFFSLPILPKAFSKRVKASPFSTVIYHNARLDRLAQHIARGTAGYFVHPRLLTAAMKTLAQAAGAKVRASATTPAIALGEDQVVLRGAITITASLLLVAHNEPGDVLADLGLPVRTMPLSPLIVSALDVPASDKKTMPRHDILHVVEMNEQSELGIFYYSRDTLHLRLISSSIASGNRAAELSAMMTSLQRDGIIPTQLNLNKARGAVWRPPAGVALEMETHVAKRTLLAGTAGGFADSITGQTLWPSVQSGLLAAHVAADALRSPDPQEALTHFKNSWRKSLADKIRPPSTALHLLLPLLFANKRIVSTFTNALLYGKPI